MIEIPPSLNELSPLFPLRHSNEDNDKSEAEFR